MYIVFSKSPHESSDLMRKLHIQLTPILWFWSKSSTNILLSLVLVPCLHRIHPSIQPIPCYSVFDLTLRNFHLKKKLNIIFVKVMMNFSHVSFFTVWMEVITSTFIPTITQMTILYKIIIFSSKPRVLEIFYNFSIFYYPTKTVT